MTQSAGANAAGSRAGRAGRVLRGALIASSSVVIAAVSHLAGGGSDPGVLGTVLALTFAVLVCIALAGRQLSLLRLSIAVAVSQFVFHVLFSLGSELPPGAPGSTSMFGMVMSGGAHTLTLPAGAGGSTLAAIDATGDVRMWAGHAVAAVLTIVLLRHGGAALVVVRRLATGRLVLPAVVTRVLPASLRAGRRAVALAIADRRGVRPTSVLLATRPHRGPPSLV